MTVPTEGKAGARDLAVGLSRAMKGWLAGAGIVALVVVGLLVGANFPDDPSFVGTGAGATPTSAGGPTFEEQRILIGERCLRVEVADTPERRAQGLKNRDSLGEYSGMLFVFDAMGQRAFTMADTRIPLTIGFYDDAGLAVDMLDMDPCPADSQSCPSYQSKSPFRNAVEVARGQLPEGPLVQSCPGG